MNRYIILTLLLSLVIGCSDESGNSSNSSSIKQSDEAQQSYENEDDVESSSSADLGGLPKTVTKNRSELRALVIRFLKQRGETNTSIAAILGQVAAETEDFRYMHELGDAKYLSYLEGKNGNKFPGDGPRFKGRGYIHITGRANYRIFGKKANVDIVNKPPLAERSDVALAIMHAYLRDKRYGATGYIHAKKGNIRLLTKHINGGRNGLSKRIKYYQSYLSKLNSGVYNDILNVSSTKPPSVSANRRELL